MQAVETLSRLDAKRREQTPQALARLVVVGLFVALWFVLWVAQMPMPVPFLFVLLAEMTFFIAYWRIVFVLPNARSVELAQYGMLACEIVFHTTIVYFLGGISWLGAFAYIFGLAFANTFLDLRRGLFYTSGACLAFAALIILEATGAVPHYEYLEQGALRYSDGRFVATTLIGALGVFLSLFLWMNWVGQQLRRERDSAVRTQDDLLDARSALQRANEELEERVQLRTAELERSNAALRESEERLRTVTKNAPVVLIALDREGVVTLAEGKSLDDLGVTPEQLLGRSALEMFQGAPDVHDAIARALKGEESTAVVDAGNVVFETRLSPIVDAEGTTTGVIGVATDVTERRQAESLIAGQRRVLEMIAIGAPLDRLLDALVLFVEDQTEDMLCGVCLVSPDGARVVPIAGPSLPPSFTAALKDGVPVGPNAGSCGTAAYRRQPVVVTDIERDPLWEDYRDLALANDLRACWSTPIFSTSGAVLGTFALYYREPRGPDARSGQIVEIATGIAGIAIERHQAEAALRESESKFRAMAETVAAATFIFQGTRMRYVNSAAEMMTGYSREELLSMNFWEVIHPEQRDLVKERGMARQDGDDVPPGYEVKLLTKAGEERWVDFTAGRIDFEGQPAVLGTAFDITERKRAEELLKVAASHDPLTGLLNRRAGIAAIEERLAAARNGSGRFSVLVLDLDKFKSINDSFNHETGDAALLQFARVLQELVGDQGVVCRMGGDEFEIGLEDVGGADAQIFAQRIQQTLEHALTQDEADGTRPFFTVSIGIASYPDDGQTIGVLGHHADEAMYDAKAAGSDAIRSWGQLRSTRAA
ncbi:MAG: PAS domain S-box protein [Dehalococcoidia bacterium]